MNDNSYFFKLTPRQQLNDLLHKYAQANNGNYGDAWRELDKRWKERTGAALSWLRHRYNKAHKVNLTTPAFLEITGKTKDALIIAHEMTGNLLLHQGRIKKMNKEEFDKFIREYPPEIEKKGILLFNGVVSGASTYQQNSSSANLKSWQAAEAALDEFVGSLTSSKKTDSTIFRNRVQVIEHLKKNNIKIGKSKLYLDADSGKLRVQPDGSVLLSDVELYIRAYLKPKQKASASEDIEALQKEKLELESARLKEQIAKLVWDREKEAGKYLLRSDFEMELAARAAVFHVTLQQMAQSKAYEWIAVCRGDHTKIKDLSAMITAEIDAVLDSYASTKSFHVIFTGPPTEPKDKPQINSYEENEPD